MSDLERERVLIVDDKAANVQVVARALAPEFDSEFALSGTEALRRLAEGELPALILLDVVMPDLDGYEVCRQLKLEPRTKQIPVLFMTAEQELAGENSAMLAQMAGAADFILKPVNPKVLRQRVRVQVLLRRRERELARLKREMGRLCCRDPETGLVNRPLLLDRLQQRAIHRANPGGGQALLLVAVEPVADLGLALVPDIESRLRQEVAGRLSERAGPLDTVAKLGDRELAMVVGGLSETAEVAARQAMEVGEAILASLERPFSLGGLEIRCAARVAVAQLSDDDTDFEALLTRASRALAAADSTGQILVLGTDTPTEGPAPGA